MFCTGKSTQSINAYTERTADVSPKLPKAISVEKSKVKVHYHLSTAQTESAARDRELQIVFLR